MRRNVDGDRVRWSARIPVAEYERFKELLPVEGAFTAVITAGLQHFLNRLDEEPLLQVWAHNDLGKHLFEETRDTKQQKLDLSIPTELYTRFNEIIPHWGGATWFVRRLIASVNSSMEQDALQKQVATAVDMFLATEASAQ